MPTLPAIVLAAGLSTRMGDLFKPLLPVGGVPMIARVVASLSQTPEIGPILLVTGHRADEVVAAAGGSGATTLYNPKYQTGGMVSSAQAGVRALPPGVPAFLLSLGDQPSVRPETLSHLIRQWKKGAASVAIPAYHGKRGHPIVLSIACASDILGLQPHQPLKAVVERHKDRMIEVDVDDPGVITDIDTPADYEQLLTNDKRSSS
jgi:molybdenum cofactor cytidylyltransferase